MIGGLGEERVAGVLQEGRMIGEIIGAEGSKMGGTGARGTMGTIEAMGIEDELLRH